MRLNRVASFYAFLLHFRSEDNEEEERPATASPQAGPATRGLAVAKAPTRGRATAARASPQGRLTSLAGPTARRGGACRHGRLRPAGRGGNRPRAPPLAARCLQRGSVVGHPQGTASRG
ncbi:hypothetical protein B296_00034991 [Ensete ventricosum]|uniref:Uncharacterized protein n=1 Tax=Ensete ventricosum TaxID=4639 RepID=A0A426XPA1_ENSVE|nr:hypothetical protein B296_00034991 [Ensete ventricosum]